MKRLAVIPSDPIKAYLEGGYTSSWLTDYFNPCGIFNEVYLLSPLEQDKADLLGMTAIKTEGRELRAMIRRLKIDVVRAYGGYWPCKMACNNKVDNVPVVVSVHDSRPQWLYDPIKNADIVFCMSQAVRNTVSNKFGNQGRVWILPNRVNFDVMKPYTAEETSDLDRKFRFRFKILHVGRLTPEKNLDTLIRAIKILGPDYCLISAGKNKGGSIEYAKLAETEGVGGRCFFMGPITNDELARYYSWADCMCTPSRCEGFGMVFVEALACRAVVITSAIAPMNEYIRHMYNGLLVSDYEDPESLALAIKIGCLNKEVRDNLKKNSRESVRRFDKQRIDMQEANYYHRILEMRDRGSFRACFPDRILWSVSEIAKNTAHGIFHRAGSHYAKKEN